VIAVHHQIVDYYWRFQRWFQFSVHALVSRSDHAGAEQVHHQPTRGCRTLLVPLARFAKGVRTDYSNTLLSTWPVRADGPRQRARNYDNDERWRSIPGPDDLRQASRLIDGADVAMRQTRYDWVLGNQGATSRCRRRSSGCGATDNITRRSRTIVLARLPFATVVNAIMRIGTLRARHRVIRHHL